jgi:hypothetical protein
VSGRRSEEASAVRGYEVVTSDDRVVGQVVDVRNRFLVVESGRIHKTRHPVPREFVHVVDEAAKAFVTVPRRILMDAPKVDKNGDFDDAEAARHYGLAASYLPRSTASEHRRAELRRHMRPGFPDEHHFSSPGVLGDRRIDFRRLKTD